jgi:hypothetical protein
MLVTNITSNKQPTLLVCDGKCDKAFGICERPSIKFDENDADDYAFLADGEVDIAPECNGCFEGGHGKPKTKKHNKWCARQCERSAIIELDKPIVLPDFSQRQYNQPWKHAIGGG